MSIVSAMGWLRGNGNRGWLSHWFQSRLVVVGLGWLCLGQLEFWARFYESHLLTGWPGCVLVWKTEGQEGKRRCTNTFQASACLVFNNILVTKVSHTEFKGRHYKVTEPRARIQGWWRFTRDKWLAAKLQFTRVHLIRPCGCRMHHPCHTKLPALSSWAAGGLGTMYQWMRDSLFQKGQSVVGDSSHPSDLHTSLNENQREFLQTGQVDRWLAICFSHWPYVSVGLVAKPQLQVFTTGALRTQSEVLEM